MSRLMRSILLVIVIICMNMPVSGQNIMDQAPQAINTYDLAQSPLAKTFPVLQQAPSGSFSTEQLFIRKENKESSATLTCNNWLKTTNGGDKVILGDLDIPGTQITVEATFNRITPYPSSPYAGDLVSKHTGPSNVNYLLRPNHAEITTSNGFYATPAACEAELNKTYHAAFVYNGSTLKFYRNGYLMAQVAATGNLYQNDLLAAIGDGAGNFISGTPENLNGFINEVRIWKVARTQAEIRQYMSTSLPNPATQTGLEAYYTFEDLTNKQGNTVWNGTLNGGASINQTNTSCTFTPDSCNIKKVTPEFTAPDTVCINNPVNIINNTVGATSYYWNFCTADVSKAPTGNNIGNPGNNLVRPVFMDYAFYNGNYYGFVVNALPEGLVRLDFGNSLFNTPTSVNLGSFGGLIPTSNSAEGLRIVNNEGEWYVIMVGGYTGGPTPRILKFDFGTNLASTPVATNWGNMGNMEQPVDFDMIQENGNWYGFTVNANNNTVTRFNFTSSFNNTPTAVNLGNLGNLAYPTGLYIINDNNNYRLFITNAGNDTRSSGTFSISRLDFGSSMLNTPTGVNLGNPGNLLQHPRDLTIMRSCGQTIGFAVNGHNNNRDIIRLDFNNDLSTVPVNTSLGNIGNLSFAHSISRLFRVNENIYGFVTNVDNNTITRLAFNGCNNANISSSTSFTPPPITYNTPGTYNINLSVDDGLPTQSAFCQQVVVMPAPVQAPTQNLILCGGETKKIGTGSKNAIYHWNTGAASDSITVSTAGTYYVEITSFGCKVADTFIIKTSNCVPPVAGFTAPDTICVNNSLTITNTSVDASTYYWNFCVGNLNAPPVGTNLGNMSGTFTSPVYIDYVQDNGNFYGFATDNWTGKLIRMDFGNSLLNNPTLYNYGDFGGLLGEAIEGLQIVKNEDKWYVLVVGGYNGDGDLGPYIAKIEFGTSLTNTAPAVTNWGNIGNMDYPHDLYVFSDNGHWYGLTVNSSNHTVTRFDFTTSFSNTPTALNLGNIGGLNGPTGIHAIQDNGNWYAFVTNSVGNTLTRLNFGNSLLNTPTGTNLGNPGGVFKTCWDIYIIKFCGELLGYVINANTSSNDLVKLDFHNNITNNTPDAVSFGNIGGMLFPHCLSKIFRVGADLYSLVANVNNQSFTRLRFEGCTNASISNSTALSPPPITYNAPGTYNINLTVDDGLPTQDVFCKQVVVMPAPVQAPTAYKKVCPSQSITIGTGNRYATYLWNTGATTDSIKVFAAGTYWVETNSFGCKVTDTFHIRTSNCDETQLSNIINAYTPVLNYDPCQNILQVEDASAYKVGDTVLMIQMKGAVIDSSNTSNFGAITEYRNAGNYEFNYISAINGNNVTLKNVLQRTYNIPDGLVQLVRVPYYQSVVVTSTLTALPWDGSKGGVLAFNVKDILELSADMDVSAKGFRKKNPLNSTLVTCNEQGWYYDASTNQGAEKGEGIHTLTAARNFGRGAPSNAGGGGNGHNAGGGGGANGGAGGEGGDQWESCDNIVEHVGGKGGKALQNSATLNKLYLGGSGGMGQGNDHNEYPSGSGGGIVIVQTAGLISNGFTIKANGENGSPCPGGACGDGMSGGGAGGTVLLDIQQVFDPAMVEVKGGNGADHVSANNFRHGPGGGGGGGFIAIAQPSTSAKYILNTTGGMNGVNTTFGNDPHFATKGANGQVINSFNFAIDVNPFFKNIDSIRFTTTKITCSQYEFKGIGYTKNSPIVSWLWNFDDTKTAATQNAIHDYENLGTYNIKLIGTDANGCKDSASSALNITSLSFDFNYKQDVCDPLVVQFFNLGSNTNDPYWIFDDGNTATGTLNPTHTYAKEGIYTVKYSVHQGVCIDTVTKIINLNLIKDDIITTQDTTICAGTTKKLLTKPALRFCWMPQTYLDDPYSPTPTTSTPQNITYYFTAEVTGNNLITNGDFSAGNIGFSSEYTSSSSNTLEGQYAVTPSPQTWNALLSDCKDHTTGGGSMMAVNGSSVLDLNVWKQTITVTPNTNYAFSTWIQALYPPNPAQLSFSINGKQVGVPITASLPTCTWSQFYVTWNSGNTTTATISIVNKNTIVQGNDFALDDISFAQVLIKRDSVKIAVEYPVVKTNPDTTVCLKAPVPLQTIGATTYSWSPATGLSNPAIANPVAAVEAATEYIVTGTTANGCVAKDTVMINTFVKPAITHTPDTLVCRNSSIPLSVSGGNTYSWSPATGLNNPGIANPIAQIGIEDITYTATIKDGNKCEYEATVAVTIRAYPSFSATGNKEICEGSSVTMQATGGDFYNWSPVNMFNNVNSDKPETTPDTTTDYSVYIRENTCNFDTIINMRVTVNPNPTITAQKVSDINCNTPTTQLSAISDATKFQWMPATGLDNPFKANPVSSADTTTAYEVQGTTQFGCTASAFVTVKVSKDGIPRFVVPNAFTPNGDGKNDCFGIQRWGDSKVEEFTIYNRWGQVVFKTTDPHQCWNGTSNGKQLDSGGYVFIIKARTLCGEFTRRGIVMLVR